MTSILMYGTKDEDRPFAQAWAKKHGVEVKMTDQIITDQTLAMAKGVDGISTLQVAPLPEDGYARLKKMGIKQIAQRSAGFDMYDLKAASENGIIISNVPSYSPESIAEFALTTALELVRRVPQIAVKVAEHDFRWQVPLRGRVVGHMTVAVLGTGRIGAHAAKLFAGMGARVLGYDRHPNPDLAGIVTYVDDLTDAIAQADLVTIHMPARADNHHLIDKEMLTHFKEGAYLVNTARGALVDTAALLDALDAGKLAGAGLDVYEDEGPLVPVDWRGKQISDPLFARLLANDRVIYTPHVAYYTDEAVANLVEGGLDATLEVLTNGDTVNRVNDLPN